MVPTGPARGQMPRDGLTVTLPGSAVHPRTVAVAAALKPDGKGVDNVAIRLSLEAQMPWTFLAVDSHEAELRETVRQLTLLNPGAETLTAASGEDALALLEERRVIPSMLFVDYHLPGMNGLELLGEVRHRRWLERAPVAMLTRAVPDRTVVTCYRLGACAFLVKPVKAFELREAVRDFGQPSVHMAAATVVPAQAPRLRGAAA